MIARIRRIMANKRFERDLDRRLAARRIMRPQRQSAARKGWEARRG